MKPFIILYLFVFGFISEASGNDLVPQVLEKGEEVFAEDHSDQRAVIKKGS